MKTRLLLALSALVVLGGTVVSVNGQTAQKAMTNADVVQLVKLGMSPEIVLAAIRGSGRTEFDVSAPGLLSLKQAGVPDTVVVAMMGAGVTLNPDDLATPRAPGIYIDVGDSKPTLVLLEPAVFSQGKSGGFLKSALTYGIAKMKWRAVVRSPAANQRTGNGQPTFYFYFENRTTGLSPGAFSSMILGGATSPNEFVLAKVTVKKDSRELVVGEMGALGGSSGARSEDTVEFSTERLSPGAYRVRPKRALTVGEYCFFYGGGGGVGMGGMAGPSMQRIFDFGVDGGRASPSGS